MSCKGGSVLCFVFVVQDVQVWGAAILSCQEAVPAEG